MAHTGELQPVPEVRLEDRPLERQEYALVNFMFIWSWARPTPEFHALVFIYIFLVEQFGTHSNDINMSA